MSFLLRVQWIDFSSPDKCLRLNYHSSQFLSVQLSICSRFQHQADDLIIFSYVFVLKQKSLILIPKILPLFTTVWSLMFHSKCGTFDLYLERESSNDHLCMHIKWSIRTLINSVNLILKNCNLSFCKLLIIWNCADKGAESFPLLSRWNKLHQIIIINIKSYHNK